MKVLILGGAGLMAEAAEEDLLEFDPELVSKMTVADLDPKSVKTRVEALSSSKVSGEVVDIFNHDSLVQLMKKHDIVLHAATGSTTHAAVKAALEARVNIITLLSLSSYSAPDAPYDELGQTTEEYLTTLDNTFKQTGLIGILGLGSMPGTSNVLGRYIGDKFDTIDSMEFSYVHAHFGEVKTVFPFDPGDVIAQYTKPALVFRDGKFVFLPPRSDRKASQYPEPIGRIETYNIRHTEATHFSRQYRDKGIKHICTKTSLGHELLNKLDFLDRIGLLDPEPLKVGSASVIPQEVVISRIRKQQAEHPKTKVKTMSYSCSRLVITGDISGQKTEYTVDLLTGPYKGYTIAQHKTGIPGAIGLRMIWRGEIAQKGCYTPNYHVDPEIYFKELSRREMQIHYTGRYPLTDFRL